MVRDAALRLLTMRSVRSLRTLRRFLDTTLWFARFCHLFGRYKGRRIAP